MLFREAETKDIPRMQLVRNSVRENALSNPALITDNDYEVFITERGKGWVCEIDNTIVGFAVADLQENNIWALFLLPEFEKKGIGTQLHNIMMDWYFNQQKSHVWLSTSPNTSAEQFYRKHGWRETDIYGKGEIKFEMNKTDWTTKLSEL